MVVRISSRDSNSFRLPTYDVWLQCRGNRSTTADWGQAILNTDPRASSKRWRADDVLLELFEASDEKSNSKWTAECSGACRRWVSMRRAQSTSNHPATSSSDSPVLMEQRTLRVVILSRAAGLPLKKERFTGFAWSILLYVHRCLGHTRRETNEGSHGAWGRQVANPRVVGQR